MYRHAIYGLNLQILVEVVSTMLCTTTYKYVISIIFLIYDTMCLFESRISSLLCTCMYKQEVHWEKNNKMSHKILIILKEKYSETGMSLRPVRLDKHTLWGQVFIQCLVEL